MRVLVACEFSGLVRDAFIARGHDAMSCDLEPTEAPGPHYRGDVRDLLVPDAWDLLIAHPPCTYLAKSGIRWYNLRRAEREPLMHEAIEFFRLFLDAPVPRVCVENPRLLPDARRIIGRQTQTIQPWEFGHPEQKATCLWLRGLPPLLAADDARHIMAGRSWQEVHRITYTNPGPNRQRDRSRSFPGIADAMAEQWG